MKVTEFAHGLTLAAPSPGYVRSSGLHASDIYNAFYKQQDPKRFDKRDAHGDPLPFDLVKMEVGTAFEEVLEPALAARLLGERPGEFTTEEGIIYSPDYLFVKNGEMILGEFKMTWYSSKDMPINEKTDKWFTQIKLYCYWLQITRARLYVLYINGDYKPPSPILLAWDLQFSEEELERHWKMIERFAKKKGLIPHD